MPKKIISLAVLCAALAAAVIGLPVANHRGGSVAADTPMKKELEQFSGARVFFGHQSVGENLLQGINELVAERGAPGIAIVELKDIDRLPQRGYILHTKVGENTRPDSKAAAFQRAIEENRKVIDIAVLKYCYVDVTASSDVQRLFADYDSLLRRLQAQYPEITFIAATVPLRTSAAVPGWTRKVWETRLRRLARMYDVEDADNLKRNQFNDLVRRAYSQRPLFDIAKAESTAADGRREGFQWGSTFNAGLLHDYSSDGGHLNPAGRRVVAREFIRAVVSAGGR